MTNKSAIKRKTSVMAILVVAVMLLCSASPLFSTVNNDTSVYAETTISSTESVQNPATRNYVSIGDSVTNGYGMFEYYADGPAEKDINISTQRPDGNSYSMGLNTAVANGYPSLVLSHLKDSQYRDSDWSLIQLATSGMRMDELRYLVDDDFFTQYPNGADEYMPNGQLVDAMKRWANKHSTHQTHEERYGFCIDCMSEFRNYYKSSIESASLITINLGNNNFGTFVTGGIQDYLKGDSEIGNKFSFSTYLDDDGLFDEFFTAAFDSILYELVSQGDEGSIVATLLEADMLIQSAIHDPAAGEKLDAMFQSALDSENGDHMGAIIYALESAGEKFSDLALDYRERSEQTSIEISGSYEYAGIAKFVDLLEYLTSSMIYGLVGCIMNYDASMEWILDSCDDDVEIIVIGGDNIASELLLSVEGIVDGMDCIPLGKIYGSIIDLTNLYIEYISPATISENVVFIDAPEVHTYFDQLIDDEGLSAELWYHILNDFGMYYHDKCDNNCGKHLVSLVSKLSSDEFKKKNQILVDLLTEKGFYTGNKLDFTKLLTPKGLESFSDSLRTILNASIQNTTPQHALSEYIENNVFDPTKYSTYLQSDLINDVNLSEITFLVSTISTIDGLISNMKSVENTLRTCFGYNTVHVGTFIGTGASKIIGNLPEKIKNSENLTEAEYSLLNVYVKYLLSSGVGCHPDTTGHKDFTEAVINGLDEFNLEDRARQSIQDSLSYIETYLQDEKAELEVALQILENNINELRSEYGDIETLEVMISEFRVATELCIKQTLVNDIVIPVQEYLETTGANIEDAISILEAKIASVYQKFGEEYTALITDTKGQIESLIGEKFGTSLPPTSMTPFMMSDSGTIYKCGTLVSIGDSVAVGSGLEDKTQRYSYLVAQKLGLDPTDSGSFIDLSQSGLRVQDIRYNISGDVVRDDYSLKYDLTPGSYIEAIAHADKILFDAGGNDFRYILVQVMENYLGGDDVFKMDFNNFSIIDESDKELLTSIQTWSSATIEGIENVDVKKIAGLIKISLESSLYGYLGLVEHYVPTIMTIQQINPDAEIYTLGMYNQYDGIFYDDEEYFIDLGEIYGYGVKLVNAHIEKFSNIAGATYVDVYDADTPLTEMADYGNPVANIYNTENGIPLVYIATTTDGGKNTHPSAKGHALMADRLMDAIGDSLPSHDYEIMYDETGHWNICSECGNKSDMVPHSGGEATCKDLAVCDTCFQKYGSLDSTKHAGGTETRGETSTYTGDTYCMGCNTKLSSGETKSPGGSGNGGSGGSGNGGSSSGGSSSSGSTSNNTVTNPDGSKTTTTKDKDGNTVKTTTHTDGKVVTETLYKDGDVRVVTMNTDGSKVDILTEKGDVADGSLDKVTTVTTDKDGKSKTVIEIDWNSDCGKYIIDGTVEISSTGTVSSDIGIDVLIPVIDGRSDLTEHMVHVLDTLDDLHDDFGTMDLDLGFDLGTEELDFEIDHAIMDKAAKKGAEFRFHGKDFEFRFGSDVALELSKHGKKISMSMKDGDKKDLNDKQKNRVGDKRTLQLDAFVGDLGIHELGGTIWIDFDHDATGSDTPVMYHMDDDAKFKAKETKYDSGKKRISFGTDHFSYYVVGTAADAEQDAPATDTESEDNTLLIVGAVIAVVIVGIVAVRLVRRS